MANNYLQFSSGIYSITEAEKAWIEKVLADPGDAEDGALDDDEYAMFWDDDYQSPGFEWEIEADADAGESLPMLWIYAEEGGSPSLVARFVQAFLEKFRPMETFTMSWAETCSKMRLDQFGGGAMFVTSLQSEFLSTDTWMQEKTKKLDAAVEG